MLYNKMNLYLANSAVLIVKLHNLHWNVVGEQFQPVHEFTEGLYDAFFASYDSVAELMKQRNVYPKASLASYLKVSNVEELSDEADYRPEEVLKVVKADLELMKNVAIEVRAAADEKNDFVVVSYFEDEIKNLDKQLWFLSAMLK